MERELKSSIPPPQVDRPASEMSISAESVHPSPPRQTVARRDRLVLIAGLAALALTSWAYLGYMAWHMGMEMDMGMEMAMPRLQAWQAADFLALFAMWSIMMVAMMVPSAAPVVLLFARVNRQRRERDDPALPAAILVAGYVLVWTLFSAVATLAQWRLHEAALLSPMMASTSPLLGGLLLVAAGSFQWTPLKRACLTHCRSPLGFLLSHWRDGRLGAFAMGVRHGLYCVGCCWALMALLFVAGVMNLLWVAAIAGFVLVEKLLARGETVGRIAGVALIVWGIGLIVLE